MVLTQQELEAHLWGSANILRGKTAGQDYKNYILSLMFYKRLCDQWANEIDEAIAEQEKQQGREFTEQQKSVFRTRGEHRFRIPDGANWGDVLAVSQNIGETLTEAMRAVANANGELRGVFTVDWNQPAPDGSGKTLIPNEVVHALVQHYNEVNLSNASVPSDVLGRAYEYLLKQFADDAGAKAGEFFTPPEVVEILVRILDPKPGDTLYDPTFGSLGMLVYSADYLREKGHRANAAQYFGQEMNWNNFAMGKINSVLHGLEAKLNGGASTITDPYFMDGDEVKKFSMVIANFPFSDDVWWLRPEQQTDDKKKKTSLKKQIFKDGYKDQHGRFGRGTPYSAPPASYGDYAFVLHILASLNETGRAGIVCPQGVLFRGQPAIEEETGEFDKKGNPKIKRRKADDEHLIRKALLDARLIDAVISLPLNVFYGAGVPACLLILRKERPKTRKDKLLLVYAARHYRELSNQNELRPQDVMRILVHVQAYGDAQKVPTLIEKHSSRIFAQIKHREQQAIERLHAEYRDHEQTVEESNRQLAEIREKLEQVTEKSDTKSLKDQIKKIEKQLAKARTKLVERDEKINEEKRKADDDRSDVECVGDELRSLYEDDNELMKHCQVVAMDEIEENEFNLNVPRYVDTFEPEPIIDVKDALQELVFASKIAHKENEKLVGILGEIGYAIP